MTFVFWQGIISIHQKSFLEALALRPGAGKVLLVVENDITQYRKDMGWDVPDIANVSVVRSPTPLQVHEIIDTHQDAVHIMGGIRVGAMLSTAFDYCIKLGCKLGIMTEPYNDAGIKGWLRTMKYKSYGAQYFRHIQFVLAIGRQGVAQYTRLGYPAAHLFPWAYFISVPAVKRIEQPQNTQRIFYAGRLEAAKGIYPFTEGLVKSGSDNYTLDIYGTGADEDKLKQLVSEHKLTHRIAFHPFLNYDELLKKYAAYDWVVLPSAAKDGWGVIVSEGLLNGLKAICSNICGASRIITNGVNGVTFDWNTPGSCEAAITAMLTGSGYADPGKIKSWAEAGISAEAGAAYFTEIMECVYNKKPKPGLPWE